MIVSVTATVQYACYLNDTKANKVKAYAEKNNCTLEEAVWGLYVNDKLDLYDDYTESDFSTESIDQVDEGEE